jgi:phage terminase large subunit GpA-like protein
VASISTRTTRRQQPDSWAATNRTYGPETGVPGARNPSLTPYVIDFERAFSDPRYRRVILVTAAQSGKTDAVLDVIGERLDNHPAPIIYVAPSKEFAPTSSSRGWSSCFGSRHHSQARCSVVWTARNKRKL